jgi:hypothetical protein
MSSSRNDRQPEKQSHQLTALAATHMGIETAPDMTIETGVQWTPNASASDRIFLNRASLSQITDPIAIL